MVAKVSFMRSSVVNIEKDGIKAGKIYFKIDYTNGKSVLSASCRREKFYRQNRQEMN